MWHGGIRWARRLCLVDQCRYVCAHVCVDVCRCRGESTCTRTLVDSPGLEGLDCSLVEASRLFQATRDHLLKRPRWFEKVSVLPQRESLLIGADWTSDFEHCDRFINFYIAASWPLQNQDPETLIYPPFLSGTGRVEILKEKNLTIWAWKKTKNDSGIVPMWWKTKCNKTSKCFVDCKVIYKY